MNANLLEISNVNSNTGFVKIHLGKEDLVTQTDIVIHIIHPVEILDLLDNILNKTNILEPKQRKLLQTEISEITYKLKTIIPTKRLKRGLINGIGIMSNWLFGTMDEQDRQNIEKHLQLIDQNNHVLITNYNDQIKINNQFHRTINQIKTIIENDRKIVSNQINILEDSLSKQNLYLDLLLKIQFIKEKIYAIQDNIASIRHGIIHPNILTEEEIENYEIDFYKLQYLKLGLAQFKESSLLLAIKIPRKIKSVQLEVIIPVPNKENKEIDSVNEIIFTFNNKTYTYEKLKTLNELTLSKHCIFKNNCQLINNKLIEIVKIDKETILIKNANNLHINQSCDNRNIIVSNHVLIHFNNCTLNIMDHYFSNLKNMFQERFYYPLNQTYNFKNKITFNEIVLENENNVNVIKELKIHKHVSYIFDMIIFVIGIIGAIVLFKKFGYFKINKRIQENSNLKEGEVTYSPNPLCNKVHYLPDTTSALPVIIKTSANSSNSIPTKITDAKFAFPVIPK